MTQANSSTIESYLSDCKLGDKHLLLVVRNKVSGAEQSALFSRNLPLFNLRLRLAVRRLTKRLSITALVSCLLFALTAQAQTLPLDPNRWTVDPGQSDQSSTFAVSDGIAFDFPVSPYPDPYATPPWYGYLLIPWTAPLNGNNLTVTVRVVTQPFNPLKVVRFNYQSDANNTCATPANARVYFQTGDLYNGIDGTRWWASPIAWQLQDGTTTLTVPMFPGNFSSTFGHFGNTMKDAFWNAALHPTYVGLTFGGGCFFGHGVNVSKGTARFTLLSYSIQ